MYKLLYLACSTAVYVLENYLSIRQHRRFLIQTRPEELKAIVNEDDFLKSQAYGLDKSNFGFVSGAFTQIQTTLILLWDVLPWFWWYSGTLFQSADREILRSIIFFVITSILSTILSLPFSLYFNFVIEQRHGFNKQTLGLFFADLAKELLVGGIIAIPVLAAFLRIVQIAGDSFYFWTWMFMLAFSLVMTTIYPTLIQPLFNKFTPLEEGELRTKIEALSERVKFPLKKLYVVDGSKRSSHSNAYFYGFFNNKRIVLFDTLLQQSDHEEICAVLAHELGHWKHHHVLKALLISQLHLFLIFFLFSLSIHFQPLYRSFGFDNEPILIGFLLFQYIYLPFEAIAGYAMNILSRKHEFEADLFAKRLGYAKVLRSGLIKLATQNRGPLYPDPMYSAYHYSHPPLAERLNALGKVS
ncbi:peptidase family M48-domain-containing protein [Cladochytrium replicatum]|nr:peptidase family M48-domain-containing protein [Cladochytrium replicatum]